MHFSDSKGRCWSIDDDTLTDELRAIEAEAARRDGRPPRRDGLVFIDVRAHQDLMARKERAFDEADARFHRPRVILVKRGDWVRLGGYRFRVSDVDPKTGIIQTVRIGEDGEVVSSAPCHGDGLPPDESDAPEPDALTPPATLRDGYDRARWQREAHKAALGDRAI
jgi:hypothetical protein